MARKTSAPPPEDGHNLDPYALRGSKGLDHSSGYVREEWLRELISQRSRVRSFQEMRDNEPIVGAILLWFESQLRAVPWPVIPADENVSIALEAAEHLSECMNDMDQTWEELVSSVIGSMLPFGFALEEMVFKQRKGIVKNERGTRDTLKSSRYNDGRVGIATVSLRPANTIEQWDIDDDTGEIIGAWQVSPPRFERVYIPMDKCLLFRTTASSGNPEGRSILRNAWTSYKYVKTIRELEAIGIERDAAGMPVMQVPPQIMSSNASTDQQALLTTLQGLVTEIRRNEREGLIVPSEVGPDGKSTGYKLSLMASGGSRQIDPDKVIRRYESRIALSVLAESVLLGLDGHGSFALADSKTSVTALAMRGFAMSIAAVINRKLVRTLFELNPRFPVESWPHIEPGDFETQDLAALGTFISQMVGSGVIQPDKALERKARSVANLPEPEETDDVDGFDFTNAINAIANGASEQTSTQPNVDEEGET